MAPKSFNELAGAILTLLAFVVAAYMAVVLDNAEARGAILPLLGLGASYLLRGKQIDNNIGK